MTLNQLKYNFKTCKFCHLYAREATDTNFSPPFCQPPQSVRQHRRSNAFTQFKMPPPSPPPHLLSRAFTQFLRCLVGRVDTRYSIPRVCEWTRSNDPWSSSFDSHPRFRRALNSLFIRPGRTTSSVRHRYRPCRFRCGSRLRRIALFLALASSAVTVLLSHAAAAEAEQNNIKAVAGGVPMRPAAWIKLR